MFLVIASCRARAKASVLRLLWACLACFVFGNKNLLVKKARGRDRSRKIWNLKFEMMEVDEVTESSSSSISSPCRGVNRFIQLTPRNAWHLPWQHTQGLILTMNHWSRQSNAEERRDQGERGKKMRTDWDCPVGATIPCHHQRLLEVSHLWIQLRERRAFHSMKIKIPFAWPAAEGSAKILACC